MKIFLLQLITVFRFSGAYPVYDYAIPTGYSEIQGEGSALQAKNEPIITKAFYLHSAPEEDDSDLVKGFQTIKKHRTYNIVFINPPSQNIKSAALALQKAKRREKTIVYVLTKKIDVAALQTAIQTKPKKQNKPEVYFIKYEKPEEAAYAQQKIQEEYDSFGESSSVSDEGIAPSTSVVGIASNGSATSRYLPELIKE